MRFSKTMRTTRTTRSSMRCGRPRLASEPRVSTRLKAASSPMMKSLTTMKREKKMVMVMVTAMAISVMTLMTTKTTLATTTSDETVSFAGYS